MKITVKNLVLTGLLVFASIFIIAAPAISLFEFSYEGLTYLSYSGYDLISQNISSEKAYSLSVLTLCLGFFCIGLSLFSFFVKKKFNKDFLCSAIIFLLLVAASFYLIGGVGLCQSAGNIYVYDLGLTVKDIIGATLATYSYIPIIIVGIISLIFIVLSKFMPNDIMIKQNNEANSAKEGNEDTQYGMADSKMPQAQSNVEQKGGLSSGKVNAVYDTTAKSDTYSVIRELKSLLDEGILTEEEFIVEKKKILNGNK